MWQPTCSIETLKKRAEIISTIRTFFQQKGVLEVETPLLSNAAITDPYIQNMTAEFLAHGSTQGKKLFLQTSPEYAMKRLLAGGSGCIYQISKAFRQGDAGQLHNPEFSILEWYRLNFSHLELMDEMDELLQLVLNVEPAKRYTYGQLFESVTNLNPHLSTKDMLFNYLKSAGIQLDPAGITRNDCLDLIMSHVIEPTLVIDRPVFIYDFPASHAALAKIRYEENPAVASRFEVYFKGIELANGFHELQDAAEQRRRFEAERTFRLENNIPVGPIDELFLASLASGLPDCAGVALGIDRLIMLALGIANIKEILSFSFEVA